MPGNQVWRTMVLKVRFVSGGVAWLLLQAFRFGREDITIFMPLPLDPSPLEIQARKVGVGSCRFPQAEIPLALPSGNLAP